MFPMMGLLAMLFLLGAAVSLGALVPQVRKPAIVCAAGLMMGSTSSCVLTWGLALAGEAAFSTRVGEVGFFVGYAGGLILGGCLGVVMALKLIRRS
jgi:hypothetical protein